MCAHDSGLSPGTQAHGATGDFIHGLGDLHLRLRSLALGAEDGGPRASALRRPRHR